MLLGELHFFKRANIFLRSANNFVKWVHKKWGGGGTNERPGTDHGTSGPMRGLKNDYTRWQRQTSRRTCREYDSCTTRVLKI